MSTRMAGLWCVHSAILAHPCVLIAFSRCSYTWHSILQDVIAISINDRVKDSSAMHFFRK
jgi:hypothetical protein